jgi:uncharacterized protein YfeS
MQATPFQKQQVLEALYKYAAMHIKAAQQQLSHCVTNMGITSDVNSSGLDAADVILLAVAFGKHNCLGRLKHDMRLLDNLTREDVMTVLEEYEVHTVVYNLVAEERRVAA